MSSRSTVRMLSYRTLLGVSLLAAPLASCAVEPYCFDCVDDTIDSGRADAGDAGARDAGDTGAQDAQADTNPSDAWVMPDGCSLTATEVCNLFDDDCDTRIDEGIDTTTDIDNCGSCGHRCTYAHAFADCAASTCSMGDCQVGYFDLNHDATDGCEYRCISTGAEICDRRDNNCDGNIDEGFMLDTDPNNCGICGRICHLAHTATSSCMAGDCVVGTCAAGFVDADGVTTNGCEYACTPSASGVETCNRIDDDCDGTIDEGDPGAGGSCGSSTGICTPGVLHCVGGTLTCQGGTSPGVETCNNLDDDCDGTVDDGNPGGGPACGNTIGACLPGRLACTAGSLQCVGGTGPAPEACNGIDDDCDGTVDNGNPGGGGSCGTDTGACMAGTQQCMGGSLSCVGDIGPTLETCNTVDDDCNGVVDDGFNLMTDARNCGMCGRVCTFNHAVASCSAGTCTLAACAGGYVNLNGNMADGCEYMCTRTSSTESCNGIDDNCDGRIDEGVTPPPGLCRTVGACAGTTVTCSGAGGFVCNYATGLPGVESCDGIDNDCNGVVDDGIPGVGIACNNMGMGACFRTGTTRCNTATRAVECSAPVVSPTAEICDGIDNDCNGTVDNGTLGTWTRIRPAGGPADGSMDFWIMSYEASRSSPTTSRVCSEAGRLPWTSITPAEAATACTTVGGTLCTEAQWQRACQSSTGTCTWSESTACTTYSATTCNGLDYDSDAVMAGNQDTLINAGSAAACFTPWSVTVGASTFTGNVFDMSGNAEEWTAPRSAGVNPLRGGSYNDLQGGMTCGFNFEVAGDTIRLPNVGFRCCRTTAPP